MILHNCVFEKSAATIAQCPADDCKEIAFAGRSNVGKSSFINAMLNRKNLARTSSTPGKTRLLNFYRINDVYRFTDLPGYGYARVSKTERAAWGKMMEAYLSSRKNLCEVMLLVDSRHEPTELDCIMYDWMIRTGRTGYVIATKTDKLGKTIVQKNLTQIARTLDIKDRSLLLPFSAVTKDRVEEMWRVIDGIFLSE